MSAEHPEEGRHSRSDRICELVPLFKRKMQLMISRQHTGQLQSACM